MVIITNKLISYIILNHVEYPNESIVENILYITKSKIICIKKKNKKCVVVRQISLLLPPANTPLA